jgi:hypothetical protein
MFSLLLSVLVKACSIRLEPTSVPLWTEEELEFFVQLWLVILSVWIKTTMFLLYHSVRCNTYEMVLHKCYVNDLHTTTCSDMLSHHRNWQVSIIKFADGFSKAAPKSYKEATMHLTINNECQWAMTPQAKQNNLSSRSRTIAAHPSVFCKQTRSMQASIGLETD